LLVAPTDSGGGGERIAWALLTQYLQRHLPAWLVVRQRRTDHPQVLALHTPGAWEQAIHGLVDRLNQTARHVRGVYRLQKYVRGLARPNLVRFGRYTAGHEIFEYPETARLLHLPPQPPTVLHLHNLHGGYFDLRYLPYFSQRLPVVLTLHDAWLLSGHCAHSLDCERWLTGCGRCPDLTLYPALARDGTAYNWRRKQQLYRRSRLTIVTPSRWLMDKVARSMLAPAIQQAEVIPNGINLALFRPGDQAAARAELGLPPDGVLLLFAAAALKRNPWKDYATLRRALEQVGALSQVPVLLVGLGDAAPPEQLGRATLRFVPFERDETRVARYYQAADVYVHPARADTFPGVVLEALASGLPVVATAIGGIPEQITALNDHPDSQANGLLTPPGDAAALAAALLRLIDDAALRRTLGHNARRAAEQHFDEQMMVNRYLALYAALLPHHA
jgi:glycosyltransferase involved in cell wall biosynthesis